MFRLFLLPTARRRFLLLSSLVCFLITITTKTHSQTTVKAIIMDDSFDSVSRWRLDQAIKILDSVFNSETFAAMVSSEQFNVGNEGLNGRQILDLIRSGRDNFARKPADSSIDLRVRVYDAYQGGGEFGATGMRDRVTATHRCYILRTNLLCYVSHLAHEYMHQIGFYDKKDWLFGTKTKSVPYKIGNIVDAIIDNKIHCMAQKDTCPK